MAYQNWSRYLRRKIRTTRSSFIFGNRQVGDIVDWGNDKSYRFDGKRWKKVEDVDEMELSITDEATEISDTTLPSAKALSDFKTNAEAQVIAAKVAADAAILLAKEEAAAAVIAAEAAAALLVTAAKAEAAAATLAAKAEAAEAIVLAKAEAAADIAATNVTVANVTAAQTGVDSVIKSLGTKVNFNLGLTQYETK